MYLKTTEIDFETSYKILIGSVVPRPIAWVSTTSKSGINNLAPFSFFNAVSSAPPIIVFSAGLKSVKTEDGYEVGAKDTLKNIKDTSEFVVNIVSRSLVEKMNQTSANYPPEVSEFDAVGLTPVASHIVSPPRVGESLVSLECRLYQHIEFGKEAGAGNLVIGEVVCFHVDDSVYKNGHIDVDLLDPVGRLAGISYCTVKDRFDIARPKL
jgi:flavin reductase (DIM6/NTAB) family NADH-FMN oxidoreductase RutF